MIQVDLNEASSQRWRLTAEQRDQARELMQLYRHDVGVDYKLASFLVDAASFVIRPDYWAEMESLASQADVPFADVVVCNCYYDILKVIWGCTAFAVQTDDGPILHGRNLDWWTENGLLERYSTECRFINGPAGEFSTIGWPGFIGAFSGLAPGRFAVTLNAVLSSDRSAIAEPVVFQLRTLLEQAGGFDEAKRALIGNPLPCDCLLLLSGIDKGDAVVIERTPSRSATRELGDANFICVTNGYHVLQPNHQPGISILEATSCSRFDRITKLLSEAKPQTLDDCLRHLSDSEIRMNMTVQQMAFCAATGDLAVRYPLHAALRNAPPGETGIRARIPGIP